VSAQGLLLLAYDGENPRCRALADWAGRRDARGILVAFPIQNPELARMAPELAGLPLLGRVHALDLRSRAMYADEQVVVPILRRLPGWSWLAPLAGWVPLARGFYRWLGRP
jgi:predicted DCC family thiol-disulfide oxidoreductase YuxK